MRKQRLHRERMEIRAGLWRKNQTKANENGMRMDSKQNSILNQISNMAVYRAWAGDGDWTSLAESGLM